MVTKNFVLTSEKEMKRMVINYKLVSNINGCAKVKQLISLSTETNNFFFFRFFFRYHKREIVIVCY